MNTRCRLCLDALNDDFVPIFKANEEATETEIAKITTKYFGITLSEEEKMCNSCWYQLNDFHQFWLRIEQKQETLRQHFATVCVFKSEVVLVEELNKMSSCAKDELNGVKDKVLCEPQIEISVEPEVFSNASQEFADADAEEATEMTTSILSSEGEAEDDLLDEESENDVLPVRTCLLWKIKQKCTQSISKSNAGEKSEEEQLSETGAKVSALKGQRIASVRRKLDTFLAEKAPQLKCSICAANKFSNFNTLLQHFRTEHNKPGYIICCDKRFPKRSLYADHLKWHDNPEIFKCLKCNKCMSDQKSFKRHANYMHPPGDEKFLQCEFCPRKFSKQHVLTNHLKSHCESTAKKKQICEICSLSFSLRAELKDHLKRAHRHEIGQMCDICGKNLRTKSTLLAHIQAVHNVGEQLPEVQCGVCAKWFRNEHSLEGHMYIHRDEASGRQYVCNICGAVKTTRQSLHSHKKYHHSAVVHKCTMCDKTFKRDLNLREHVATHTGEALYHCEFCKQTFKSHRNKYAHTKKAHPAQLTRRADERSRPPNKPQEAQHM